MRTSWTLLFAFIVGCGGTTGSDAGPDAVCVPPVVHICVRELDGALATNATLHGTAPGEIPFLGHTGSDGCGELDLSPGQWTVQASTASMCSSDRTVVDVPPCGRLELPLNANLCSDGSR